MAETIKSPAQVAPSATTETDLYTVPAATTAMTSSIVVSNRGATATTFRVSIRAGGGATANKDYLYYDVAIPANDTFAATLGMGLAAGDVVRVYAGNGSLSFSLGLVEYS